MNEFILLTDSACDIDAETLKKNGIDAISLSLLFDGEAKEILNTEISAADFYKRMRAGETAKTSAVNVAGFKDFFEGYLREGKDILYLGFSTGLSTTCNSAKIAAEELSADYPDSRIVVIDTLAASAGQGLLVMLAARMKSEGKTLSEIAEYVENNKLKLCHWFTVDDLVYLKRGGRVSSAVAFVGGLLNIKPVLHVDNEGHLVSVSKVRGRKNAIKALADKYGELAEELESKDVYISHGDCLEDARELANILNNSYGATVSYIADVGPVIGAHSGPGTLALFFIGKER
ncbi:MAG: DegV family protein [Ruminococcaceae bacterium]|nr:DegV family protein [Oscillospiraceae bacterium]